MANAELKLQVEQVLDALPETATLGDLLCALELLADEAGPLDREPPLDTDASFADASLALGLRDTCSTRRRRAADEP